MLPRNHFCNSVENPSITLKRLKQVQDDYDLTYYRKRYEHLININPSCYTMAEKIFINGYEKGVRTHE